MLVCAWTETIPFELNCSLELVAVSCAFCLVTLGVLCQTLLIASSPEFLQHFLAGGRADVCPFACYTVAALPSEISKAVGEVGLLQPCKFPLERLDLSLKINCVGVRSFCGMGVTDFFSSGLHILIWWEDFHETLAEREQF